MKIISAPENFKVRMEGELLLSPQPAEQDVYIGQYTGFVRPPASIDIVHSSTHQQVEYSGSATVIGPPENWWQAIKLVWAILQWYCRIKKPRGEYERRTAWKKPNS